MLLEGFFAYFLFVAFAVWNLRDYSPTLKTYGLSMAEFLVTYIVGNLPFLILAFDLSLQKESVGLVGFLAEEGRPGEIFIYISAFLAPVIYTFLAWYKDANMVWHSLYFILIFACLMVGLHLFLRYRSLQFFENDFADMVSLSLYVVSLSLWYFSIVYYRSLQEQNFSKAKSNDVLEKVKREEY
ncbi:hypothetical protein ACFO0E_00980 [Chromohalobacter beijerinckii]|uniref:Uncharacterized protein n=1 Tax=Chromohalobacter beijerinckii TaxID=86179 RepID=A0ABV8XCI0_9GAMM|nr:hypothetical protein [Chromohalobacter beijerinckii]MCK0766349.1 hypothetical protein [Chromohalobacter beijerinckii]